MLVNEKDLQDNRGIYIESCKASDRNIYRYDSDNGYYDGKYIFPDSRRNFVWWIFGGNRSTIHLQEWQRTDFYA